MDIQRAEPLGDVWQYDPNYHRTAEFLGVNEYDRKDYELASKISFLTDWADKTGKKDISDKLITIDSLRKQVGTQAIGKILVNQLYQQIRLSPSPKKVLASTTQPKPANKSTSFKDTMKQTIQKHISDATRQVLENQKMLAQVMGANQMKSVNKLIGKTVQDQINSMAQRTLSDKKLISSTVKATIGEALK